MCHSQPIFIMGCQRSGTTLVSQILDSHDNIAIYHESFYYHILHGEQKYYRDLSKTDNLRYFAQDVAGILHKQARHVGNSDRVFTPSAEQIAGRVKTPGFAGVLDAVLSLYAQAAGKQRYGEKTPENYQYLGDILHDFPAAKVIFCVRDPRDTILSSQKMFNASLEQGIHMWNAAFRSYTRHRDRVKLVRYEDLVSAPERVVRELCAFIGEPYHDSLMSFFEQIPQSFLARRKQLSLVGSPISTQAIGRFREMDSRDVRLIEACCAEGMQAMGYAPTEPVDASLQVPRRRRFRTLRFLLSRLRYYGFNYERWLHGWARWKVMLKARLRYWFSLPRRA